MFAKRILKPLGVPIVFGAPVGHTVRPMLTVPLGVRARLDASGAGTLEILEGCGYAMTKGKHVHVIGIGGSAMSPLAGMLREKGLACDRVGFGRVSAGFDISGKHGDFVFSQL